MHKYFRWSGLFLFILTLCVCGCSGSGSSADPMGTGTVQFVAEYNAPFGTGITGTTVVVTTASVQPNSSLTLTAWVSNFTSEGKIVPVINEKVTFTLDIPGTGARLVVLNDRTASNGQARVVYTAGDTCAQDVVRVTTEVGATASITITKPDCAEPIDRVIALSASQNPVAPLGLSAITATVTLIDTAGTKTPLSYQRVTFTLLTNKGASLSAQSGLTDASGQVTITYQAGYNDSEDVIQASLTNGAGAQVIITVTSTVTPTDPPVPPVPLSIAVAALPTSVTAGQVSIVTATLTGDDKAGTTVTFSLPINNSGATLSASSAVTDGAGKAVVSYQSGSNSPTLSVSDTVRATVGSISSTAAITRTVTAPLAFITVTAVPTTLPANTSASTITANVQDSTGTAIAGVPINFAVTGVAPLGTLSAAPWITDATGNKTITFTGGGAGKPAGAQDTVTASITIAGNPYSASVVITYP